MTTPTTVPEVLDAAASYIEEHGWNQGSYRNDEGGVCAEGAIRLVCGASLDGLAQRSGDIQLTLAATGALESEIDPDGEIMLPSWNDIPGRTAAEVVAKLRATAEAVRAAQ